MKFLAHQNFWHYGIKMLQEFERYNVTANEIEDVRVLYPVETSIEEWLDVARKQGASHRPAILIIDDGSEANAVGRQAMRESRCSFVVFSKSWLNSNWQGVVWRLLKTWPEIITAAEASRANHSECRIDVSVNGKLKISNL